MKGLKLRGNKRIWGVIAVFVLLGTSFVLIEFYSNKILSGFRGYIYGEGQWTKSQKQATISLLNLIHEQEEEFYSEFQSHLQVYRGDRIASDEMLSDQPHLDVAYQGLLMGGNRPENIDDMIWVFRSFRNVGLIRQTLETWIEGNRKIGELQNLADEVYSKLRQDSLTIEQTRNYEEELMRIDRKLTVLEIQFSSKIDEAATYVSTLTFWITTSISLFLILVAAYFLFLILFSLKKANRRLAESQAKFSNVLNHSRDVIYQYKPGATEYDYLSSSVEDMLGYSLDEVKNGGPEFILERLHPDDLQRIKKELNDVNRLGMKEDTLLYDTEFRIKRADGEYICVNNKRSPLKDENGKIVAVVGNVRDISEQKRHLDQIDQSLKEKQILLAEIHHRVKNNLAIVASLIELQKERLSEPVKDQLKEVQLRIKSIALVHEKLYATDSYSKIDMSQYIRELSQVIDKTYHHEAQNIEIVYNLDRIEIEIVSAVTLGLILNEMINNCYKHAFDKGETGVIEIEFKKMNKDKAILKVIDSGGKLSGDFDPAKLDSLGMTLIGTLADQLKGAFEFEGGERTEFSVLFPL